MNLIVATDEKTATTAFVVQYLNELGHTVKLAGHLASESQKWHWADIGRAAAEKVASGDADQAILFCWSGTGVCMAANKIPKVRAALCWTSEIANLARKWDDANILCMSLKETTPGLAKDIIDAWFATKFDEEGLNQVNKV